MRKITYHIVLSESQWVSDISFVVDSKDSFFNNSCRVTMKLIKGCPGNTTSNTTRYNKYEERRKIKNKNICISRKCLIYITVRHENYNVLIFSFINYSFYKSWFYLLWINPRKKIISCYGSPGNTQFFHQHQLPLTPINLYTALTYIIKAFLSLLNYFLSYNLFQNNAENYGYFIVFQKFESSGR